MGTVWRLIESHAVFFFFIQIKMYFFLSLCSTQLRYFDDIDHGSKLSKYHFGHLKH